MNRAICMVRDGSHAWQPYQPSLDIASPLSSSSSENRHIELHRFYGKPCKPHHQAQGMRIETIPDRENASPQERAPLHRCLSMCEAFDFHIDRPRPIAHAMHPTQRGGMT